MRYMKRSNANATPKCVDLELALLKRNFQILLQLVMVAYLYYIVDLYLLCLKGNVFRFIHVQHQLRYTCIAMDKVTSMYGMRNVSVSIIFLSLCIFIWHDYLFVFYLFPLLFTYDGQIFNVFVLTVRSMKTLEDIFHLQALKRTIQVLDVFTS